VGSKFCLKQIQSNLRNIHSPEIAKEGRKNAQWLRLKSFTLIEPVMEEYLKNILRLWNSKSFQYFQPNSLCLSTTNKIPSGMQ